MDLKDHAKAKEARRAERATRERTTKGPEIAWDEQVYPLATDEAAPVPPHVPVPTNDSATPTPPPAPAPAAPRIKPT